MGSRNVAASAYASYMKSSPWDAVAVNVRPPASEAPMRALIEECSLSTASISAFNEPSALKW